MTIHEEFHRLVLRKRWIDWSVRNYRPGDYELKPPGRHQVLSERLRRWAPTWEERNGFRVLERLEIWEMDQ